MITSALFLLIIRDIRYALQTIWLNYKHYSLYENLFLFRFPSKDIKKVFFTYLLTNVKHSVLITC